VLEGIGFLNRLVLEGAEAATGERVREIRFGGGGAANAIWGQMKADICERRVVVTDCAEPGLLAGAICAAAALGRLPDIAAGQAAWVVPRAVFEPAPDRVAVYRRLYGLFRKAEAAVAPISRSLAGLAAPA
jgi:xylulokinase